MVLHVVWLSSYTQVSVNDTRSRTELNSHGDTTAVGSSSTLVLCDYKQPVCVHGYTTDVASNDNCCIVSAVVAYDHPETGDTYMLVFNQTILIDHLPTTLVSPMQLQDIGICVNDKPKSSIVVPSDNGSITLQILLHIQGVTMYFDSRKLTKQEFKACNLKIDMTTDLPDWDPLTTWFEEQENSMLDNYGQL